ncbi:MAG TPA: aspartyl protease family protein [Pyrinomonadaceae bacterium]|jgi:hypothetical protein|nr:aspartyl protease family protein [Pyrinomonadaceae bacterium]
MSKLGNHVRAVTLAACLLSLPGAVAPARPPQAAGAGKPGAQRITRIPFELNGNSIFLQLRVNTSRLLWFALDTGAYSSILNTPVLRSLDLKTDGGGVATGAGGSVESVRLSGVNFDVGGAPLRDLSISALALTPLENSTGRAMDGILGSEFFRRYVVEIDYDSKEIGLYEPATFHYEGRGESLPLSFIDNHPYVRAKVELPGRDPIEGEFVIDAGSNLALILLPSFIEQHGLRDALPPTLRTYGRGVGGEVALPVGRAARLRLGGFSVERPVTAFPSEGTFGRAGKAGNIGSAILRHFRVVFDYSRRRVILEPNRQFSAPFEYDMSGLSLVTESPAFQVVRVLRVIPRSPAEEAGLRQGDEIVTFGGRPAADYKLSALREMLRQADRKYSLQVKRGAETLTVEIKTRRLI